MNLSVVWAIWLYFFCLMNSVFVFVFIKTIEPPKDDGGAAVTKYVVELSEGLSGELKVPI